MAMSAHGSSLSSHTATAAAASVAAPCDPRKAYAKPTLELLGSVRDLTLGCTGGNLEGGKKRRPVPGCP